MAFPYLGLKQNIYHYYKLACTKIQEELLFFLPMSELQIRCGIEDNSKIIFLIPQ